MVRENVEIAFRETGIRVIKRNLDDLGESANKATRGIFLLQRALFVIGGFGIARAFQQFSDSLTNVENRIRLTTNSTRELNNVQSALFDIASRSRADFEGVAQTYTRTALSAKALGKSQEEVLNFTESVTKAAILSGASVREINASLIQLGQGIASNRLGGDELRSILEQLPFVADVIAKELGVTRGELRELGSAGKVTGEVILSAFKNAKDEIDALFGQTQPTIEQAFSVMKTEALRFLDTFDDMTGLSSKIADGILLVSKSFETLAVVAASVAIAIVGSFGGSAIAAVVKYYNTIKAGAVVELAMVTRLNAIRTAQVAKRQVEVTSLAIRQQEIASTLSLVAAKKALLQQEVLSAQFVTRGNSTRLLQSGQFISASKAAENLASAQQRLSIVEAAAISIAAKQTATGAQAAKAATALAGAQGRLAVAAKAAQGVFYRFATVLPFLAGLLMKIGGLFKYLWAIIRANPIGLVITALLALQTYFSFQTDTVEELTKVQNELNEAMQNYAQTGAQESLKVAAELAAEQVKLTKAIKETTAARAASEASTPYTFDASSGLGSGYTDYEISGAASAADTAAIAADAALFKQKQITMELISQREIFYEQVTAIRSKVAEHAKELQYMQWTKAISDENNLKIMEIVNAKKQEAETARLVLQYGENSNQLADYKAMLDKESALKKLEELGATESIKNVLLETIDLTNKLNKEKTSQENLAKALEILDAKKQEVDLTMLIATYGEDSYQAAQAKADAEVRAVTAQLDQLQIYGELREQIVQATYAASILNSTDMSASIKSAIDSAIELVAKLSEAIGMAARAAAGINSLVEGFSMLKSGFGSIGDGSFFSGAKDFLFGSDLAPGSSVRPPRKPFEVDVPDIKKAGGGGGASDAEKEYNDLLKERDKILEDTRTAQELFNSELAKLDLLLQKNLISEEVYQRAVMKLNDELKEAADNMKLVEAGAKGAASAFTAWAFEGANLMDALIGKVTELAARLFEAQLTDQFTTILGNLLPNLKLPDSFDGGGYTGQGTRSGGMDGRGGFMAMLHPDESVVDHRKGGRGGGNVIVNIVNNSGAEVTQTESNGQNGQKTIQVMIEKGMKDSFYSGKMDGMLKSEYGLKRRPR